MKQELTITLRPSKDKKAAKAKADKYFGKYIRLRDAGKPCVTCGNYNELQCGHFMQRDKEPTRYDEQNSHGQCVHCNYYKSGRQVQHGEAIDRMYGKGTAERLSLKSKMRSHRKKHDYEYIAATYAQKIKELA